MRTIQSLGLGCTLLWAVACGSVDTQSARSTETVAPVLPQATAVAGASSGGADDAGGMGEGGASGEPLSDDAGAGGQPESVFSGAVSDSAFWDTRLFRVAGVAPNQSTTHDYQARLVFDTTAEAITIGGERNPFSTLDVFVNGQSYANPTMSGTPTSAGVATVTLPPGQKRLELQEALVNVTSVMFDAPAYLVPPVAPAERAIFLGDSIVEGSEVSPMSGAYVSLLRHRGVFGGVYNLGVSGRKLLATMGTAAQQDALVTYLAPYIDGTDRNVLVIALGTNDYGLATAAQTPAAYALAAAQGVTKIHSAYPSLELYFLTPWPRSVETVNAAGATLEDYRMSGMLSVGALGFVNVIDGNKVTLTTVDGLHPDTAGNLVIADYLQTYFGSISH